MLTSFVTVESAPPNLETDPLRPPSTPAKAVPRNYPAVPRRDESMELDRIGQAATHPVGNDSPCYRGMSDIEMSRPGSPFLEPEDGVEALQSAWDPYMNRFRLLSACLMNFANGMNDSAPGALIPYMEKHYNIGYAVVSLIFVGNALGFITAAVCLDEMRKRFGRAKTLALAQGLMLAGYIPVICTAPFPVIVFSFFIVGFGMSINIAIGNLFCGSLRSGTTALGAMHGGYGLGGTIGPLIATAIVTVADAIWSRYYFITLGLAVFNSVFAAWSYWGYEKELGPTHHLVDPYSSSPSSALSRISGIFPAFSSRVIVLGAIFIFAYQGAEVSISGWVISFLIAARNGDPSSVGYVSAGFWAGITIGRFALSAPAHRIGEKRFVYIMVVGAVLFELLVWWVPNVIGNAVAVSIVGLLLGPVYPCATAVFIRTMSRSEKLSGLGVISAFGSSGGAVAPFTTGLLAQAVGTFVLHPIAISLFVVMLGTWYVLPSQRNRAD